MTQKLSDSVLKARAAAKVAKAADDQGWMEAVLRMGMNGATFEEWCAQVCALKGWSRETFKRRLEDFKRQHPELTGGRFQGDPYTLQMAPTAAIAERVARLRSWLPPRNLRDLEQIVHNRTASLPGPGTRAQPGAARRDTEDLIAQVRARVGPAKVG
jgi:hypothetical protein